MMKRQPLLFTLVLLACIYCASSCGRRRRHQHRPRPGPPPDRTAPHVSCPSDINVIADKYQTHAQVIWSEPVYAVDNRDGTIVATRIGRPPYTRFSKGTTIVSYYARDRANNNGRCSFTVTVTVIYCPKSESIDNGYFFYHPAMDFRYGGISTYGCHLGYKLTGTSRLECYQHNRVGYWSASTPKCEKKRCNGLLTPIRNGYVACSDSNKYQSRCTYTCKAGYRVKYGQSRVRVCGFRGWLGSEPTCEDIEGPKFNTCPKSMVVYTVRNKKDAAPNWLRPTARDNSGEPITVVLSQGYESGQWMPVGTHEIIYSAKDSTQNKAKPCRFTVIVRRLICHTIYPTPYLEVICPQGYGFGEKCSFQCDVGKNLTGDADAICEARGSPPITYWNWGVSMPTCQGRKCAALTPPKNGALACDKWLYGEFCKMMCEQTYDIPRTKADIGISMFVCLGNGDWNNEKVPDCSLPRRANRYNMRFIVNYFTGDCCSSQVQNQIRQKYIESLNNSIFSSVCKNYPGDCVVQNVDVMCGAPLQCSGQGRKKRALMDMTIQGTLTVTPSSNTSTSYAASSQVLKNMVESVKTTSQNNPPPNSTFSKFTAGTAQIECPKGLNPSYTTMSCVPCETGYSVNSNDDCAPCPVGYYQDGNGNFECTKCPDDKTTAKTGTRTADECIALCPKGSFSTYGTEPCTPCPMGSYIDLKGSKSCVPCPARTTTGLEGSTSGNDCKSYKLVFVPTEDTNYTVSANITSGLVTSLTVSLKLFLPEDPISIDPVMKLSDDNGDEIMSLSIGNSPLLSVKGCQYKISGTFLEDNWNSIVIILRSSGPSVYIRGKLTTYNTQCQTGSFQIPTSQIDTTLQSSTALNNTFAVTDVNVWHNIVPDTSTISDITSTCTSSTFGNTMSWGTVALQYPEACTVPADCDVSDNCANNPCGNTSLHSCIDKVNDYSCVCLDGFTGKNCETNIDDCFQHMCENNATCVDGVDDYSCKCELGYRGEFCNVEIVNGGWSEWSDWSTCSQSCDNGTMTKQRTCDQPSPDSDGLPCDGDSTEVSSCHLEACRSCNNFSTPENGYTNCTYDPDSDMTNCTVSCDPGHAFAVEPLDMYSCGYLSNYTWSTDDDSFVLPTCTKVESAKEVSAKHTVTYENTVKCTQESKQHLTNIINDNTQSMDCIKNNQCKVANVDINCPTSKRSTTAMSFVLVLTMTGQSGSQPLTGDQVTKQLSGPAQGLYDAAVILYNQIAAGNFSVYTASGTHIVLGQDVVAQITCYKPGYTWFDYFCIPCEYGYYEENYICLQCPMGSYNPLLGQSQCTKCPLGLTTAGIGSKSSSDCNVPYEVPTTTAKVIAPGVNVESDEPKEVENTNDKTMLLAATIGGPAAAVLLVVIVVTSIILGMKKCKGQQKTKESKRIRNKDYVTNEDSNDNDVNYASMWNNLPPANTTLTHQNMYTNPTFINSNDLTRNDTGFLWEQKKPTKLRVASKEENGDRTRPRPPSVVTSINSIVGSSNFDIDRAVTPLG